MTNGGQKGERNDTVAEPAFEIVKYDGSGSGSCEEAGEKWS